MKLKAKMIFVGAVLFAALPALISTATAKTVQFSNDTSSAIVKLQARATGTTTPWPADMIKQIPLGVHKARPFDLAGTACKYDLFITFDDGRQLIQPGIAVCGASPVSIKQVVE